MLKSDERRHIKNGSQRFEAICFLVTASMHNFSYENLSGYTEHTPRDLQRKKKTK